MLSLEIRCSETASEAILGQEIIGSYMARGVLHPNFGCPCTQSQDCIAHSQNPKIAFQSGDFEL